MFEENPEVEEKVAELRGLEENEGFLPLSLPILELWVKDVEKEALAEIERVWHSRRRLRWKGRCGAGRIEQVTKSQFLSRSLVEVQRQINSWMA
jgi:hypothetical protein